MELNVSGFLLTAIFLLGMVVGASIALIIQGLKGSNRRKDERDDLNFRIGGVGITKVDYAKSYEAHREFIQRLIGDDDK